MIDFNNNSVFKLKKVEASKFDSELRDLLIDGENINTFGSVVPSAIFSTTFW